LLIEDAAQAFAGDGSMQDSTSDVIFLSFGPIKTCTALGGAVVLLRDPSAAQRLSQRLAGYPAQTWQEFLLRVLKMMLVQCLTWPPAFTALVTVLTVFRIDPDRLLSSLVRGFAGPDFWNRLRRRPAAALLGLLDRRLRTFDPQVISQRQQRSQRLLELLGPSVVRPGGVAARHTHWVLPLSVPQPDRFAGLLRRRGYDATRLASSLAQHAGEGCAEDRRWSQLVYLPAHPSVEPEKLAAIVRSLVADEERSRAAGPVISAARNSPAGAYRP
jgi:dTDP-4-amino-4,6-dideoxygalactose transaminase